MECLKYLDTIGYSINFLDRSDRKFRTNYGGFLSIILGFSYLALFFFLGSDDFYKLNPQSFYQVDPMNNDFYLNLTKNSFIAGVEVSSLGNKIENKDRKFQILFTFNSFYQNGTDRRIVSYALNKTKCDKVPLKNIDANIFNLSNYECPDLTYLNETIEGTFSSAVLKYIRVEIHNCDHNGKNCASHDDVINTFSKDTIIISVLYPEVFYNKDNYTHPLKTQLNSRYSILNPRRYAMEEMYISDNTVEDHETKNLFFSENNKHHNLGVEYFKIVTTVRPTDFMGDELPPPEIFKKIPKIFYGLSFILGSIKNSYSRKYKTIVDTIAETNGIIVIFYQMLIIIVDLVNKMIFNRNLFKHYVIYDKEQVTDKNLNFLRENLQISEKNSIDKNSSSIHRLRTIENNSRKNSSKKNKKSFVSFQKLSNLDINKIQSQNNELVSNNKNNNIDYINNQNKNINNENEIKDNYLDGEEECENNEIRNKIIFSKDIHLKEERKEILESNAHLNRNDIDIDNNKKKIDHKTKNEIKISLYKESEKYKYNTNDLSINYFDACVKKKSNLSKIFDKFAKNIDKKFDFRTYLESIYKLKILKNILLNPYQLSILDMMSKKNYRIAEVDGDIILKKYRGEKKNLKDIIDYLSNYEEIDAYDIEVFRKFFYF